MGRRPTPTAVLRFRGSEKGLARAEEPQGTNGPPLMLPEVACDEIARRHFDRLIEDLRRMGLYAAEDYKAHNSLAYYQAEFERMAAECREKGLVVETNGISHISAWKKARDEARDQVAKLSREFGLTPASRVGLVGSGKSKGDASGIEALLKSKTA